MSTAILQHAPPAPSDTGPGAVVAWQKECLQAGSFEVLGKIWMISLDVALGANTPHKKVADTLGSRIEFYNELGGPEVIGPRIAQTGPRGSLLILDPFVRNDGFVGLPDIPDPAWVAPIPTADQISWQPPPKPKNAKKSWRAPAAPEAYKPPRPHMIPQHLVDQGDGYGGRCRGQITAGTSRYIVCGPVAQIVVRPLDQQNRILPNGLIFKCLPSTNVPGAQSTLMDLLIDINTGEAFFYGGRFEIGNPG